MMDTVIAVDPYKKMAYSEKVSFDITNTRSLNEAPSSVIVKSNDDYNPEVSIKKTPSKEWELDVKALISTKKWLQNYGLQKNKLTIQQILPAIGFKMSEDFDWTIKRPVSSRYAEGLFNQIMKPDGKMYNITCGRDKLRQLESRLTQAIYLYKRRLEWLTLESRRLFGVIEEKAITIVLDIRNMSPQQFDLYRMALERVLYEQVTQIAKFNLIRAADDMKMYQETCVPVTHDTVEGAIKWLWDLDRLAGVSSTACVEAVLRAIEDRQNECVYLYTEGSSVDSCRQLLKEKVCAVQKKPPIHVVSYNCDNSETVRFLREFSSATGGKYHIYAVIMEMDSYEGLPVDTNTNRANILLKKKTFGGIPPGAGVREDVILLFQEMEEARMALGQIQKLIGITPEPNIVLGALQEEMLCVCKYELVKETVQTLIRWFPQKLSDLGQHESELAPMMDMSRLSEEYMSSRHWLEKYGLAARKLELFDILSGVAFHHKDGVVDVQKQPMDEYQTDAIRTRKLVNAKYCDRFPVVKWRDGKVVHVQVTPELHRTYEQKMLVALRAVQNRIDWLSQGSRALFGTLIEDQIYILIDTSESMVPSIQYVKDKLFLLMQEQLRHKMKFNLTAFNSKAQVWQNRLVEVSETSLEGAWKWIQGLSCWGSTNTYAGLQHALSDPGTQAIYLLTDGRPDQPPKSIIAQVQMKHCVPVHTISFNCNDTDANQFLYDLARATGGRYHYFSEKGMDPEGQPKSWESEDIRMLKDELNQGLTDLDKVAELRDECAKLSWKKEIDILKKCSRNHPMPQTDRLSAVPSMDPRELYRSGSISPPPRPSSAPPDRQLTPTPPPKITTSVESRSFTKAKRPVTARRSSSARPGSAKGPVKPLAAGHTRTSLLRTLNSRGSFNPEEWLLPETRQLFEKQAERQKKLAKVEARESRAFTARRRTRARKLHTTSTKQWLQKYGLVAKKMTLLDALAPTFIPHKATYVPILDKHVLAKVFDEVLPIAHVSNKSRRPLKLINPNGANLKVYEERLQRLINMYSRRLDEMVWEALPSETTEEEFGVVEEPVSFLNNRSWFIKALEEADWPVSEQDIYRLESEIERAEKFLQQSKDLRKAANNGDDDDELTVYDDKASNVSGLSARSREISQSKESVSSMSSKSSSISKVSKVSSLSSHHSHHSSLKGSLELPISVSIKKRVKKRVRRPGDPGGSRSRTDSEVTASDNDSRLESDVTDKENKEMVGIRVIACYSKDGLYYPGHVSSTKESVYAVVTFNFKKKQKVRTQMMIPISGAIPMPELSRGDFVLVRVYNQSRELECYVPGIIEFLPDPRQTPRFFTVLMYNGQTATTMRKCIVKIGRARFDMAVKYIAHVQQARLRSDGMKLSPRSQRSDSIVSDSQSETRAHKHHSTHRNKTSDRYSDRESTDHSGQYSDRSTSHSERSSKRSERSDRTLTDDGASERSSQRPGSRRKKEKFTKRMMKTKEAKQRSNARKKSRTRSSSGSRSRSHSRSQSDSRSSSSRSRSRSVSPSSGRTRSSRTNSSRSRSSARSYSRSRSRSSSRSRSRPRSRASFRSYSSGARSRSESRTSRSSSRSGSRTPTQRSRTKMVGSKSRSRSRGSDSSGSITPCNSPIERPSNPVPKPRPISPPMRTNSTFDNVTRTDIYGEDGKYGTPGHSRLANTDEKDEIIGDLQYQLEKQKRKQLRQEQRLVRQARKINKIQSRLSRNHHNDSMQSEKSKSTRSSSEETDTSPQRRKGSPDGISCRESSDLLGSRRALPGLLRGQEVLARWRDDGWYYHGCVDGERGGNCYAVRDATGHVEQIIREDILTEEEHKFNTVQPEDFIVALHPKYLFSYAPAEVLDTYVNGVMKVEFYDGVTHTVSSEEVYKVSKAKYEHDRKYIMEREKHLLGKSVIARDDDTGVYRLAVVDSHCGLGQQYYVKWLDGMICKQNANHIFEVGQRQMTPGEYEYVLAPVDQRNMLYKPAQVDKDDRAVIFCDGTRSSKVHLEQCFWLNKRYYKNAVDFYLSKNQGY